MTLDHAPHLRAVLRQLPAAPGVYLMKGADGRVLYVGKADLLRNRVRSYFGAAPAPDARIARMASEVAAIEYIVTDTVSEAYLLECNLIKEHRPRYNIRLRDDKSYPFVKITLGEDFPRIVRTAEVTLVLPPDSFDERFASAQDVAELHGGFVQISTGRERAGTLVMRVPSGQFADAMRDLRALGDVEVQTIQGEDVTAEYIDLQARLRIAKSRREVLLGLMAKAVSIEQTIRVQNVLDDTQLRIEELQGSIGLLEDRTSFATIRVQLHEEGVEPEAEVKNPSVTTAWDRAIAGFFGVIAGVVVGLGYLLPILAIGAVVWFSVRWVRRRRAA